MSCKGWEREQRWSPGGQGEVSGMEGRGEPPSPGASRKGVLGAGKEQQWGQGRGRVLRGRGSMEEALGAGNSMELERGRNSYLSAVAIDKAAVSSASWEKHSQPVCLVEP